jgi:hypothetical protein
VILVFSDFDGKELDYSQVETLVEAKQAMDVMEYEGSGVVHYAVDDAGTVYTRDELESLKG